MYIGIIDNDLSKKRGLYPNLELMKLSTQLKRNKDGIIFLKDKNLWRRFDKVYFFQNDKSIKLPHFLTESDVIECRGNYFYKEYSPLNDEIDSLIPDRIIYDSAPLICSTTEKSKFTTRLNKTHFRLSVDNNFTLEDKGKGMLIHDSNPAMYLDKIEYCSTLGKMEFIYPLVFSDLAATASVVCNPNILSNTVVKYTGEINVDFIRYMDDIEAKLPIHLNIFEQCPQECSFKIGCIYINQYCALIDALVKCKTKIIPQYWFKDDRVQLLVNILFKVINAPINLLTQEERNIIKTYAPDIKKLLIKQGVM